MLTIYAGRDLLPPHLPPAVPMLLPWREADDGSSAVQDIFDEYVRIAPTIFSAAPLESATVGVLPFSWKYTLHHPELRRWAHEFAGVLAAAGKHVIVFFDSDSFQPVDLRNAIVFRTSGYRSKRHPSEFGLPGWGQCVNQRLDVRVKGSPVVGFCGYAPPFKIPLSKRKIKESVRWVLVRTGVDSIANVDPGYFSRVEAIRSCRRTSGLKTNFLIRSEPSFVVDQDGWGTGKLRGDTQGSTGSFQSAFMKNMLDSDYVLCTRGFGNYSFRLYEALSCGRIPVFVDTDCLLPFYDNPEWRSSTLWIDQGDVATIGERIVDFHSMISAEEFLERQHAARRLWEQWLSPTAFFTRLAATLPATLGTLSSTHNL